ncbi:hypothetical protein [Fibrella forsythiae]|uniref:Uncharacterized protein n=1 Tax=Fibrella forsythiae TaxID=2817061 RepID=A0ABS3JCS9_9BACT|nr:hypothetical protein [Fibrella forsythiae]MBO0947801.1 hypothetical protein [Fibrella forsythiae]
MQLSLWLVGLLYVLHSPAPISAVPQPKNPSASPAGWQYQQTPDPSGGTAYKATLDAIDLLQLPYPYAGGSTVTLTIRARGGTTNAYLSVSKGLLAPSFQGGKALIQFDAGKPVTFSLSAAANGRGNLIFFDDTEQLTRKVRAARKMTVQLKILGQNLNQVTFNSAGLRWNH